MAALPRDSSSIVATMGIMKMGAVLVPVSMSYPEGRINKIREDSGAVMFVGTDRTDGMTAYSDVMKDADDAETPRPDIGILAPCLVMYTSGSTGNPKGAVLRHFGFINSAGTPYEDNTVSYYTKKYVHAFLGITPTTFQFFYLELCICLANACTYVIADLEHSRSPILMAEYMKEYGVDFITGTPSRILQYLDIPVYAEAFRKVCVLGIGGERTPSGLPEAVHRLTRSAIS
jgi:acyl-coenzyme A synthetase/AMP-(fatty) acid ligase